MFTKFTRFSQLVGILAALATISLAVVFIYFNPYTEYLHTKHYIPTMLIYLAAPALIVILGSLFKKPALICIGFLWSLPFSHDTLSTSGLFQAFGYIVFFYLLSAILFAIDARLQIQKKGNEKLDIGANETIEKEKVKETSDEENL